MTRLASLDAFRGFTIAQAYGSRTTLLYAPQRALEIAPVNASLLYALLFNTAMFAVAWFMWSKKWIVKVQIEDGLCSLI